MIYFLYFSALFLGILFVKNLWGPISGWIKEWVGAAIWLLALLFVGCFSVFIWIRFFQGSNHELMAVKVSADVAAFGQLGDFFGGFLNPLLSFVAVMAVLYNIKIQREELKGAKEEASKTNAIQDKQAKIFEKQSFDSLFFKLLEAQVEILKQVTHRNGEYGRSAIHQIKQDIIRDLFRQRSGDLSLSKERYREIIRDNMGLLSNDLGHYFRNLYQVMKILDKTGYLGVDYVHDEHGKLIRDHKRKEYLARADYFERREYSNILRAQLCESQIALLFFNGLTGDGEGLRFYIEKYSLLKTLSKSDVEVGGNLAGGFYGGNAFLGAESLNYAAVLGLEDPSRRKIMRVVRARRRRIAPVE